MFHKSTTQAWHSIPSSACHVQDGVCFLRVLTQLVNRLGCRQHEQLDMAAPGFLFHFVHDRQAARSGADDQPSAFPRDLFLRRKRRVAETLSEFLGRLLLTLADLATVDDHVVLVSDAVDADRTEGERLEAAAAGESPTDRFHCLHCFHVASLNAIYMVWETLSSRVWILSVLRLASLNK